MLNRCHNSNVKGFADYGARGITVCPIFLTVTLIEEVA